MNELRETSYVAPSQPVKKLRDDFLTAQFIEIGIVIQMLKGTYAASEYLKSRQVDEDLMRRALTQPLHRRAGWDWDQIES